MRLLSLCGVLLLAVSGLAQELPQSVDLVQRIDQLYPWLRAANVAVDQQGNFYLTADVQSPLPDVITKRYGPLGAPNNTYRYNIVVVKLDPTGQHILYGTAIGGSNANYSGPIRIDSAGNLYLAGYTVSEDFPATTILGIHRGGVFLKLDFDGNLVYSLLLGSLEFYPSSLEVDSAGEIYASGSIHTGDLPTAPSAFRATPPDPAASMQPFILKVDGLGTRIETATYLPGSGVWGIRLRRDGDIVFSTAHTIGALDGSLSALLFSNSAESTTSLQLDGAENIYVAGTLGLKKYTPDGQHVLLSLDFPSPTSFGGFTVTRSGLIFLFLVVPPNFQTHNGTLPCDVNLQTRFSSILASGRVLMVIGPQGDQRYVTYMPEAVWMTVSPLNDHPYGIAYVPASPTTIGWIGLVHFNPDELPGDHVSAGCLAHSGTLGYSDAAPGTILTLFGDHLGPDNGRSFAVHDGTVSFEIAGASVTVDGKPAALLYAQRNQINFVVPWSLRTDGARVPICATVNGDTSCLYTGAVPIAPGFFSVNSQIAAVNQDENINSPDHPAKFGSYVSVYLTGAGHIQGAEVDGGLAGLQLEPATATVSGTITFCDYNLSTIAPALAATRPRIGIIPTCADRTRNAPILFAGAVPTLINGAAVVIMRIPQFSNPDARFGTVTLNLISSPEGFPVTVSGKIFLGP